jgi:hypothetical protein
MAVSSTSFQKGHTRSRGHRGVYKARDICTQVLISMLNEIDPSTKKARVYELCETLWKLAIGYSYIKQVMDKDGNVKDVVEEVPPDVVAIRELIDRTQGKTPVALSVDAHVSVKDEMPHEEAIEEAKRLGLPTRILTLDLKPAEPTTNRNGSR